MRAIIITSILSSFLLLWSCDYLDKMPDDQKTMDMVWKSRKETEAYLYNVYHNLPDDNDIWKYVPWVGSADEADMVWERYLNASINVGNWNAVNAHYTPWNEFYNAIRASFVFENNVDKCSELTSELITQYKAESKFLRGYYYWRLLRQYGPFVLIEEVIDENSTLPALPRTPYDKCVEYICRMMDEAETDLPFSWKTKKEWLGKPDKIVCRAVKSQVLLMAASLQWNGNPAYQSFQNQDGTLLVSPNYDPSKWVAAAEAAKALIDLASTAPSGSEIRLYKNNENGDAVFNPYKSVRDVHLERWNCEVLWATTKGDINDFEKHATPRPGGWNGMAVTQRQVDAFYMLNGRTIDDPSSGYEETGFAMKSHPNWLVNNVDEIKTGNSWGNRLGEWNMYANREARFYAAVLYNGRPIPQVSTADRNVYSSNANKDGWGRAEFYKEGVAGASQADHPRTGYLILKKVNPNSNPYRSEWSAWRQHTYIRLAEIYLNYIEALNEYDPTNSNIKKYWDLIRERAGLVSIFDTYPEIKGDKDKQREYILRERQVELCFEGDRYFTSRRCLLSHLEDTDRPIERRMFGDNGPMYGMNIAVGNSFTSTAFYTRTVFENRVFTKKMYLFPIPQSEMDRNKWMVQNPGW